MITRDHLVELIFNGENSGVEFKRDTLDNRGLAREIVALANLKGGRVILGVEEDGTVCGLTRQDPTGATYRRLEEWVMQACRDKIRPELIPYFEVLRDVEGGHDVAVVTVDPGWDVHHLWHVTSLPNGVTPERMRVGVQAARNQMLKDIMRDYGYLEHQGMGVPRKIVAGMREHNGTSPDLVEDEERFTVRLWR